MENLDLEYHKFKSLNPIFIGGLRRSGTTLMQRLLDGHPQLLVYPLEDCIIRDFYCPTDPRFILSNIKDFFPARDAEKILSTLTASPKLGLALASQIDTRDKVISSNNYHLGYQQQLNNEVDINIFNECFIKTLNSLKQVWKINDILTSWMFSYFVASGIEDMSSYVGWVTKCPDKAKCFQLYRSNFPNCRVIHLVRDPRAFYVSEKIKRLEKGKFLPFPVITRTIDECVESFSNESQALQSDSNNFLVIRYEDIVQDTDTTLRLVSDFLGIEFTEILTKPTFRDQLWNANSSFEVQPESQGNLNSESLGRWKSQIYLYEKALIDSILADEIVKHRYAKRIILPNFKKKIGYSIGFFLPPSESEFKTWRSNLKPQFINWYNQTKAKIRNQLKSIPGVLSIYRLIKKTLG